MSPRKRKAEDDAGNTNPKRKIRKLAPPRPWPTVPSSASPTGPKSAQKSAAGKGEICITRRTPLAAYLRRCKDLILKDGCTELRLSAMGAAIPHLAHLVLALPPALPFSPDEIRTEVTTGTVEVRDEVLPADGNEKEEEEDVEYQTRAKSTLMVVVRIGDGVEKGKDDGNGDDKVVTGKADDGQMTDTTAKAKADGAGGQGKRKGKKKQTAIVMEEPEQSDPDM